MDQASVTLRGLRKALRTARNAYMGALITADTLNEDDILDYYQDMDALRKEMWQASWRLVNNAKMYADAESDQDKAASLLSTTDSSLTEVRKLWDASYYFDKNTYMLHLFLPTYVDLFSESPESGEKRALEMTMGSSLRMGRPLSRRRTSTPNVTGENEDAGEDDLPVGTDATTHHAARQQQNTPPHTPAMIEDAENIGVDFDPGAL